MKIDFHFYLVYALAERAGFNRPLALGETEADIVAYASQYVDDNNENRDIGAEEGGPPQEFETLMSDETIGTEIQYYQRFPWSVRLPDSRNYFRPIMTQTISLKSFISMFQNNLFVPFHFLPGNPEDIPVIRGRTNPYSTTADSRNARVLLTEALDSNNLYRIGVALHTYVDTWSHQNFSGHRDEWNAVRGNLIPDIGHAEMLTKPDTISATWVDSRLPEGQRRINNRVRTRDALKTIFPWLARYRTPGRDWDDVADEFEALIQAPDSDTRIAMVKAMYPTVDLEYDEEAWIDSALTYDPETREVVARDGFLQSHWYRFQLAAKEQLATVKSMLVDII
jgi:hypothetical protein